MIKTIENSQKDIVYTGKYFCVVKEEIQDRKTPIYKVYDKNAICIAEIKWYSLWRKFCFFPISGVIWDNKCLEEIINLLNDYNDLYKYRSR